MCCILVNLRSAVAFRVAAVACIILGASIGTATASASGIDGWTVQGQLLHDSDQVAPGLEPAPRGGHSSVLASNGFMYALGGQDTSRGWAIALGSPGGRGDNVYQGNLSGPGQAVGSAAVAANGFIYSIGGSSSSSEGAKIYYLRPNGDGTFPTGGSFYGWTRNAASMPGNRSGHKAVVAGDYVYVLGGSDASGALLNSVLSGRLNADGSVSPLQSVQTMPVARAWHGAAYVAGRIFVIGGTLTGGSTTDSVISAAVTANGTLGAWRTELSLPESENQVAVAAVGNDIYVTGGSSAANGISNRTLVASVGAVGTINTWQTSPVLLPEPLVESTALALGTRIVLTGGRTSTGYSSAVYTTNTQSTLTDPQLLERFRPVLRYDSVESYRADSPAIITNSYVTASRTNLLKTSANKTLAAADPADRSADLNLAYLRSAGVAYPGGGTAAASDLIDEANPSSTSYLEDAQRLHANPAYADRTVAHVVPLSDGSRVLQYWFFYYYNPKTYLTRGAHEGDWEMIQLHVGADQQPIEAAYSQHDGGERCAWTHVQRNGDGHPIVYVAEGSHANFFSSGYHLNGGSNDNADGSGGEVQPLLLDATVVPDFLKWPGHWGGTPGATLGAESPAGPFVQGGGLKWNTPLNWSATVDGCTEGQTFAASVRAAGSGRVGPTPVRSTSSAKVATARLRARRRGRFVEVAYSFRRQTARLPVALAVSVSGGNLPVTRHVRLKAKRGRLLVPVGGGVGRTAKLAVVAFGYDGHGRRGPTKRIGLR